MLALPVDDYFSLLSVMHNSRLVHACRLDKNFSFLK